MTISYRIGQLYLAISLIGLVSCVGDEFVAFPGIGSDAAEDVKSDKPHKDAYQEDVLADADAGKHDADAKAEDVIKPLDAEAGLPEADADALVEVAEDVQEEPDAPLEDALPDKNIEPEVQPPPDAKPDSPPISTLCQQYMPDAGGYFIIGESPIGNTIRISIFGYVDFPPNDAGLIDTTKTGWCWGGLGKKTVVCPIPVPGIVPGTDIYVRPGVSIGDGDPQTAPLCESGICNQTYTLCHGQFAIGIVNGSVTSPGTVVPDQTIKYHVPQ